MAALWWGVPAKQKIFEGEEAHQVLCDYFQFALPNPCAAVIEWCNFGYKRINGIIRTRGDASVILESTIGMSSYSQSQRLERYEEFNLEWWENSVYEHIEELDAVLSSVQLPVPVRAYRGVSVYDSARWINAKPGDIQEIDTFSSLSLDEKIADHFATLPDSDNNYGKPVDGGVLLEIELPAGTPGIYIPGLASWNDNRINRNVREKELLIPRNVIFEVVSRERVSSERAPSGELVKVKVRLTGFSQNKEVPRRSTDLFKEQAEKRIQELVNDNSVQAVLGIDAPDTLRATIEKMMEKVEGRV